MKQQIRTPRQLARAIAYLRGVPVTRKRLPEEKYPRLDFRLLTEKEKYRILERQGYIK